MVGWIKLPLCRDDRSLVGRRDYNQRIILYQFTTNSTYCLCQIADPKPLRERELSTLESDHAIAQEFALSNFGFDLTGCDPPKDENDFSNPWDLEAELELFVANRAIEKIEMSEDEGSSTEDSDVICDQNI